MAIEEGDLVWLAAKVYRCNDEQALIEFTSMEGIYSIRVPIAEIVPVGGSQSRATWWARVRHWWMTGVWI